MFRGENRFSGIVKLVAISVLMFTEVALGDACSEALDKSLSYRITTIETLYGELQESFRDRLSLDDSRKMRWPKGETSDSEMITFGFESEYTITNWSKNLFNHYLPNWLDDSDLDEWKMAQDTEFIDTDIRTLWVQAKLEKLFTGTREPGRLVRAPNSHLTHLPDSLILDETGNLEIVGLPVDTMEQFVDEVKAINEDIGRGSMQASVGATYEAFRRHQGNSPNNLLGFFQFVADFDLLHKAFLGYLRLEDGPDKEVVKTITHPFLGPLTKNKREKLHESIQSTIVNNEFDPNELRQVSRSDASFKYLGTTVFRPDILPGERILFEIRDAHSNESVLFDRLHRITYYLQSGFDAFSGLDSISPFDPKKDFQKFNRSSRQMLESIYPTPIIEGSQYSEEELLALQVHQNFAFPIRAWSSVLDALNAPPELRQQVRLAVSAYRTEITRIAGDFESGRIDRRRARVLTQAALARFSAESGLLEIYLSWWIDSIQKASELVLILEDNKKAA